MAVDIERKRELARLASARYRERHREKSRAANRKWMAENRERFKETCAAYRRKNKDRIRARDKKKYKERVEYINALKIARGCVDCGYRAHPVALQFDHRDPAKKKFAISSRMNNNWEVILAEIEKCDVRCANCHQIRTFEEGHCVK
jgi:hypothetical protein